jgi:hypothetical protein
VPPAGPLRIANCSGFYGDRRSAPRELLEGGPIDVLTGDYLAELTMLILWRSRSRDPAKGYAGGFLDQMEECLGLAADRGIKVVANAGGLNPAGLADELRALAARLGLTLGVAHVEGDDLLGRLPELQAVGEPLTHLDTGVPLAAAGVAPVTANAYLGAWGIVAALEAGADLIVCGRVADASLVVGPAAWHFGWASDDWDRLAGAVVAGHVLECGTQATGGNYAFFEELPDHRPPGFPIAELAADGSAVVTKHPGTGGMVSVGTVTAQLLYEIAGPAYANPDVVARFDTVRISQAGPDRVRLSGTRGEPAPDRLKVAVNYLGGFRNSMRQVLTGLDVEAKAASAAAAATATRPPPPAWSAAPPPTRPPPRRPWPSYASPSRTPTPPRSAAPSPTPSSSWPWPAIPAATPPARPPTPPPTASTGPPWSAPTWSTRSWSWTTAAASPSRPPRLGRLAQRRDRGGTLSTAPRPLLPRPHPAGPGPGCRWGGCSGPGRGTRAGTRTWGCGRGRSAPTGSWRSSSRWSGSGS